MKANVNPSASVLQSTIFQHGIFAHLNKGGSVDENGVRHESGNPFPIPIWNVLNEPDLEHATTPQQYTQRYDAIDPDIRAVSPDTNFMSMALAILCTKPEYFERKQ